MTTADDGTADRYDVAIVGGGVAGLTAGSFTARAGLTTLIVDAGESILRRNAHLENVPGFPAGVNPRLFLDMTEAQARRAGCEFAAGEVTSVSRTDESVDAAADEAFGGESDDGTTAESDGRFVVEFDGGPVRAERVVASSWADSSYLDELDVDFRQAGSKRFVGVEDGGRTGVDGLYVAGRLAERYHQAVVAAGHGAQAGITLVHDADVPYYHDWVVPEGYFTGRGREVPPGCEEIDDAERRKRERESLAVMREYFEEPHPEPQEQHPRVGEDD